MQMDGETHRQAICTFSMRKLKTILRTFITGGMNPEKASRAAGIGLLWGIFPLIGTSTALCTVTALLLRANVALTVAINYLVYPLQLLFVVPCIMIGQSVTGNSILIPGDHSLSRIFSISQVYEMSGEFFSLILNALVGWVLTAPAIALVTFLLVRHRLEKPGRNSATEGRSHYPATKL